MKQVFVIAALMAAATVNADLAKPVTDSFLWVNEESGLNKIEIKGDNQQPFDATTLQLSEQTQGKANVKDLKIVPIKFSNPLKSPGIFLRHNFDIMQDCLNMNSDEDAWVDAAHTGYKEVPLAHVYGTSLVQLNAREPFDSFEKFDPCEALDPHF